MTSEPLLKFNSALGNPPVLYTNGQSELAVADHFQVEELSFCVRDPRVPPNGRG